tara:strand:+ start:392 stop:634 length:243 start_codon:yes stop_codon:yes gene_type:complete
MSSHSDLEENISNLEFRIDELESSEYFSKKEIQDSFITREEIKILINRFEEKILKLEEQVKKNKTDIGGLYNIQLHGNNN